MSRVPGCFAPYSPPVGNIAAMNLEGGLKITYSLNWNLTRIGDIKIDKGVWKGLDTSFEFIQFHKNWRQISEEVTALYKSCNWISGWIEFKGTLVVIQAPIIRWPNSESNAGITIHYLRLLWPYSFKGAIVICYSTRNGRQPCECLTGFPGLADHMYRSLPEG